MKKALKIASIVHIVVWIVILAMSLAEIFMYIATPPDEEPFGVFMEGAIRIVFVIAAASGIFNSALLSACLHTFFASDASKLKVLKNTALWFAVITNILFYLSVILLFAVNKDWVLIILLIWAICTLVSLVLFIVLKVKVKMIGKAEKIGDGSLSLSVTEQ